MEESNKPPFLGSWRNIYLAVLGILGLLVILFYMFTNAFS